MVNGDGFLFEVSCVQMHVVVEVGVVVFNVLQVLLNVAERPRILCIIGA